VAQVRRRFQRAQHEGGAAEKKGLWQRHARPQSLRAQRLQHALQVAAGRDHEAYRGRQLRQRG